MAGPNRSVFSRGDGGAAPPAPAAAAPIPVAPQWRSENLYPLENPQIAMMSVLRDMGVNPFRTNPFVSAIMRSAPGLSALWQLSNIGANTNDLAANGGPGQMFGDFLRGQLQNGTIMSSLQGGVQNFGQYAGQLNDLTSRLNGGPNALPISQIPPFLDSLESKLNSPNGFADIYGALAQPLLGRSLGQSFQQTLGTSALGAYDRFLRTASPTDSFLNAIMAR